MESPGGETADRIETLERRLSRIEGRIARLETLRDGGDPSMPQTERGESPADATLPTVGATETLPLLGRAVLVLGGAFVLRAATEAELVAPSTGAALGILYALIWLGVADWMAGSGHRRRATFYGLAAVVIANPLLWEITAQFRSLGPHLAALAVAVVATVAIGVSWRRGLHGLCWASVLSAVGTALVLAVAVHEPTPFFAAVLFMGALTLGLGVSRGWTALAWVVAIPACLATLLVGAIQLLADPERAATLVSPGPVLALHLGLVLVYVGGLTLRTLRTGADVRAGEMLVAVTAAAIGLGGAVAIAKATGTAPTLTGLVALLFGFTSYVASFTFIDRASRRTNFIFYTTLALASTLLGSHALLRGTGLALGLGAAALVTAGVGASHQRATLSLHGAVYAAAAFLDSGLFAHATAALSAPVLPGPSWITVTPLLVLAVTVACCALSVAEHGRTWGQLSRLPRLIQVLLAAWGLGGVVTSLFGIALPRGAGGAAEPAAVAVLRSGVLAAAALALAALARFRHVSQAAWLVYPVLLAAGVKLVVEDLRIGRPGMLVLSLALFGGALILAPRLLRQ